MTQIEFNRLYQGNQFNFKINYSQIMIIFLNVFVYASFNIYCIPIAAGFLILIYWIEKINLVKFGGTPPKISEHILTKRVLQAYLLLNLSCGFTDFIQIHFGRLRFPEKTENMKIISLNMAIVFMQCLCELLLPLCA
eukprot:TRINITY_DN16131_c0_g1_i1.p1 TRINITY_DN16131_c0_g1~~TRINITY_DN16131_c0_g1_i1.p1  ORF type:complete len:137 (-),score=8.11 TRINITY_DN16131_c0_g1_i1:40-450(-)